MRLNTYDWAALTNAWSFAGRLRACRQLGIEEAVTFLGHVPYDEMPNVYRSGDVLVLPSRAEGVPRTVLEAMASSTAIVTSQLEQIDDIVKTGGLTVEPTTGEALTKAIISLLDETAGTENRVVRNHRWKSTVEVTTDHLSTIINQHQQ